MPEKLNFLIPVDFNPESESALEYAASIARELGANLHLAYIIEEESPLLKLVIDSKQRDMIVRGATDRLDELAGRIVGGTGLNFRCTILQGKIYNRIIDAARDVEADLIFMGRTDSSDLKKNITGTNTMHIIKEADVPVITLRKKPERPGCSHIILPLDLTKQTIRKASNAIQIAKMLNAKISVISLLTDDRKSIEIKFTQRLDEIRKAFEKLGVECEVKLIHESHKNLTDQLNKSVRELDGDVIMIMTQQELDFSDYFIGSHAQAVINRSDFPVLSINPLSIEEEGIPDPMADAFINPIQMLDH